jgi:hypothetical protein
MNILQEWEQINQRIEESARQNAIRHSMIVNGPVPVEHLVAYNDESGQMITMTRRFASRRFELAHYVNWLPDYRFKGERVFSESKFEDYKAHLERAGYQVWTSKA